MYFPQYDIAYMYVTLNCNTLVLVIFNLPICICNPSNLYLFSKFGKDLKGILMLLYIFKKKNVGDNTFHNCLQSICEFQCETYLIKSLHYSHENSTCTIVLKQGYT